MKKLVILTLVFIYIISGCKCPNEPEITTEERLYLFIKSLINPNTGLVASREGECFTTVYKNSLAAMALIREGNITAAERVFAVFQTYYKNQGNNFQGFPKDWDPCTGSPLPPFNYWEGDNAFLLLSLNYYNHYTGNFGNYQDVAQGLSLWLSQRIDSCDRIIAEGVANMYAALVPFAGDCTIQQSLIKLRNCFFASVDYPNVLDHTVRGSLVFCDTAGFNYVNNFFRSEIWANDGSTKIEAYSAFTGDQFINIEISAQLLLAWKIWKSELQFDLSALQNELEKLLLQGTNDPKSMGLPYFVTDRDFPQAYSLPIIDPTCYLLFYYSNFNPFAPYKKYAHEP